MHRFLAGEPDDLPWMQSWLDLLREATAQGRRFARVRVVSLPLTDYSRFGVWCAQFTNGAGEDIRYLDRVQVQRQEILYRPDKRFHFVPGPRPFPRHVSGRLGMPPNMHEPRA